MNKLMINYRIMDSWDRDDSLSNNKIKAAESNDDVDNLQPWMLVLFLII